MKKRSLFLSLLLVLILACAGCNSTDKPLTSTSNDGQVGENPGASQTVKLYFSDDQEMYLHAEERSLQVAEANPQSLAQAVIAALIAGPQSSDLLATIPQGTKLLGVKVQAGLATVDFSQELKDNHSGGSSSESMTIYSIVNSLTELEGIDQVQILIAGQAVDTLAGHMDLNEPLEADTYLIK